MPSRPPGPVQLGSLGQRGADQQAAVRSAGDGELRGRGGAGVDEGLRGGVEVVEDVLLAVAVPGAVPGLAFLAAAAQRRQGVDAAGADPGQRGRAVGGVGVDAEAAVAGEQEG